MTTDTPREGRAARLWLDCALHEREQHRTTRNQLDTARQRVKHLEQLIVEYAQADHAWFDTLTVATRSRCERIYAAEQALRNEAEHILNPQEHTE